MDADGLTLTIAEAMATDVARGMSRRQAVSAMMRRVLAAEKALAELGIGGALVKRVIPAESARDAVGLSLEEWAARWAPRIDITTNRAAARSARNRAARTLGRHPVRTPPR